LLILLAIQFSWAQQPEVSDFFPLTVGNSWTYNYYQDSFSNGAGLIVETNSGKATYQVVGKAVYPDSTLWSLSLIRALTYHKTGPFYPSDTSWQYADSSLLTLVEIQSGYHRIYCAGNISFSDVFSFTSDFCDTTQVFRYWPSPKPDTISIQSDPTSFHDSPALRKSNFSFAKGVGIIGRAFDYNVLDGGSSMNHTLQSSVLTQVEIDRPHLDPTQFRLGEAYPNPFNPSTSIDITVIAQSYFTLCVFDVLGRRIAALLEGSLPAGTRRISWNATTFPSGMYFIVLRSGSQVLTRKVVLIK
jgi:hypothetical protein